MSVIDYFIYHFIPLGIDLVVQCRVFHRLSIVLLDQRSNHTIVHLIFGINHLTRGNHSNRFALNNLYVC